MLPEYVREERFSPGVRDLIINLNRIPDVSTGTNSSEGDVRRDIPYWPSKDGFVYFFKPNNYKHLWLVQTIGGFCREFPYFDLDGPSVVVNSPAKSRFMINGRFEDHNLGALFDRLTREEREDYFDRAELRKIELLAGWTELYGRVVEGIRRNIIKDVESLPYRILQSPVHA